jgi:membrane protein
MHITARDTLPHVKSSALKVLGRKTVQRAWAVMRRVWNRAGRHECVGLAAEVSFYFVLSVFPFFLVTAAIVGWLPSTDVWQSFAHWIINYFPQRSQNLVFSMIMNLRRGKAEFLSFGLVATLWSASSGFMSLMGALTTAYGRKDGRPYWKRRLIALGTTLGGAVFFLISFGVWTTGHWAAGTLSPSLQHLVTWQAKWRITWWIVTAALLCLGVDFLNYFLPAGKRTWKWLSPGTIFVALSFAAGTLALNLYVRLSPTFPRLYGTLAGFIILMVWIYMAILILLIGAETDSALEDLKPQGADA